MTIVDTMNVLGELATIEEQMISHQAHLHGLGKRKALLLELMCVSRGECADEFALLDNEVE